ncbi:MAG: hypothetical protein IKI84_06430 [Clostridia bacterium]|nr:hypothetical protein [Clostridia bacterium]
MARIFFYIIMLIFFLPFGAAEACVTELVPCAMPVYINGEPAAEDGEWIFTDPDGRYYADIGFLCRHIAPDFVTRTEDGAWMLRRAPLPEDAVVLFGEKILLDLEKADFCLRADPYWLEEGIFSLLERFSPVLEADGRRYERTGETALCPEDIWDAVSPEGRAMWQKDGDWWLEDGQGLVWRYAPADGCEEEWDIIQ